MPFPLIEQLAQQLNSPTNEVRETLSALVQELQRELDTINSAYIPGIGTFERSGKEIFFTPDESLSLKVNNRYAALENELVEVDAYEDPLNSSEIASKRNEETIEPSLLDNILQPNISHNSFEDHNGEFPVAQQGSSEENPFDEELLNTDRENIFSHLTSNEASSTNEVLEAASMKEEDPNSNHSDQESTDSNTEWTPFFEEFEGEEFDIDTTIDLSADDWDTEFPSPPSSPFSVEETNQQDDLYFDVDADPDDTLFSPSSSATAETTSYDNDLSWAANPLDESTDFFEDNQTIDSMSFQDTAEDVTKTFSAEDEFFSPVTGSVNTNTPDDTLFSAEAIYSEDNSQEADDTIFLAPEQTVQASDLPPDNLRQDRDPYAPPSSSRELANEAETSGANANPYAYKSSSKRKGSSSSWIWVAAAVLFLCIGAAAVAYFMELPPFGDGGNTPAVSQLPVAQDPPPTDIASSDPTTVDGSDSSADPLTSEVPVTVENPETSNSGADNSNSVEQTPVVTRIDIDRSRGGWTIVVASETQRNDAEQIADNYTLAFSDRRFPTGILTTGEYNVTRYRVGVGQFNARSDAANVLNNFKADFPDDAWLLKIE